MASMFRASPWVTYQPPAEPQVNQEHSFVLQQPLQQQPSELGGTTMVMDMDMDVDIDAPKISTLHEEKSPPPSKKSAAGRKPRAPKLKVTPAGPPERKGKTAVAQENPDNPAEDEEDQLIDDDDRSSALAPPTSAAPTATTSGRSPETTPKKKPGPKRKTKKEKAAEAAATDNAAASSSQPIPSESGSQITIEDGSASAEPVMLKLSSAGKKKASTPRKTASTARGRGRGAKVKAALLSHAALADDAATSEAGFTGTAPSSPATANTMDLGEGSPEPDNTTVAQSSPPLAPVPLPDDAANALENVPIPQYPLPTKPFPVQAPIKIATGFAPPMPLDKSTKKVRRWRTANREIRGIAGGRWFMKTWVGDKESEYSSSLGDEKITHPGNAVGKLSGMSASAPVGRGGGAGRGKKLASAVPSAVPSRSGSPPPAPVAIAPRPMTKMRILHLAPASEAGDSDMAPPES